MTSNPPIGDPSRRVLENLSTAVLLFDKRLHLGYMNPSAEMLLAMSVRQARGLTAQALFAGADVFVTSLQRALDSGHPYTERELALNLPTGMNITVDCTLTPVNDPRKTELIVELTQVDRHRRIQREESLLSQHQTTRAVVRGLAHEIKNPLGGLRGAAQLLERELANEGLKEYTRIIIGEADRLQNLVNRMLGPRALPQKRRINIHQVLEHVRNLVMAEAPGAVQIVRDYDPSIPDFNADPDQLIQAVLNLVRNAVQAVGERGRIVLRTRTMRQFNIGQQRHKLVLRIDVIDDGPGIPPDLMERIFFPMVTSRPEGTGLGLPIAQSLVNQHGGLIECTSEPGETCFTVLLPLETTDE